ncbi:DUF1491 family protein [Qipengyuania sediminis]|uniref:DUF1491 family protein n=1 Tax=Qipengyuania sediminis TaxID=1532023 RepID=UPI0010593025
MARVRRSDAAPELSCAAASRCLAFPAIVSSPMSTASLPTHVEVGAILRAAQGAGGFAAILARGERDAGTIMLVTRDRSGSNQLWERRPSLAGDRAFYPIESAAGSDSAATDYVRRRRARDPDLWVIEVDIAEAQRFVANWGT